MEEYFNPVYSGGAFQLFGTPHLVTIFIFTVVGVILIRAGREAGETRRRFLRNALAYVLLINEISWFAWEWAYGMWNIEISLPLHLCSVMVWVSVYVLLTERSAYYPLLYFLGIAGAMQALITPDADIYGFPHFRFLQTMIAHGALVIAGLWVTWVDGCRPTIRSLVEILVGLNVYAAIVYGINISIGSNYLYVVAKPEVPSLLDYLPAWPWYVFIMEGMAIVALALLYLPFVRSQPEFAT